MSTQRIESPAPSKERGILFSAPMVRALLAGTKTQTRRVVKPQPITCVGWAGGAYIERRPATMFRPAECWSILDAKMLCPYGQPGDRLWVRETHAYVAHSKLGFDVGSVIYRADDNAGWDGRWTPAIHMPRDASRITLEVTEVRVERLQDISHADAMAEGMPLDDAVHDYSKLWDRINGPGGWDANPWIWAVSFRRTT